MQAEQILATACENESDNAKRMRLGLEPVSQPMPTLPAATVSKIRTKRVARSRLVSGPSRASRLSRFTSRALLLTANFSSTTESGFFFLVSLFRFFFLQAIVNYRPLNLNSVEVVSVVSFFFFERERERECFVFK